MPVTTIRGAQVTDGTVQRVDLDVSTVGQAVVRKIVQGTNVTLSSTGADSGTGDVTINLAAVGSEDVGSIKAWPSVTPPASWMLADGSAVSRTLYPDLWALIGTTFGAGDGSTTFNLPDLRSKMIVGQGQGTGLTNRTLAATGGEETHVLSIAELPSHQHGIAGFVLGGAGGSTTNVGSGSAATQPAGSGLAHNNMPPFLVMVYVIKVSLTGASTAQAPIADSTQSGLLRKVSGNATDFVDGTNNCQNLATAVQPTIWSVRLRSINVLNNPNFEVDQRNVGTTVTFGASPVNVVAFACDRWQVARNSNIQFTVASGSASVVVPGTNFRLSSRELLFQLTTPATLAAGDYLTVSQNVEGPQFRELSLDVHSVSILAYCTKAFKFGLIIRDNNATHSLTKLCAITTPNQWTLFTFPNLPIWPGVGSFSVTPGTVGYTVTIGLAGGSTYTAPANDTWQNGNFTAALGQDSFGSLAANDQFIVGFVQDQPGPYCETLIDCPFSQNYHECLRYYTKSYNYGSAVGSTGGPRCAFNSSAAFLQTPAGYVAFPRPMAKAPTLTIYSDATGTVNAARDQPGAADRAVSASSSGEHGLSQFTMTTSMASAGLVTFHYSADTGW
jgi:microcystin-dependent protein